MVTTMKDFSVAAKPDIEFKIAHKGQGHDGPCPDGKYCCDVFYAAGDTPGGVILDLSSMGDNKDGKVAAISEFLDGVLLPDSAELFAERMRDTENPITFEQVVAVFEWLLEQYVGGEETGRPTKAHSSSSSGARRTGQSSTARARSRVSTPVEVVSDAL